MPVLHGVSNVRSLNQMLNHNGSLAIHVSSTLLEGLLWVMSILLLFGEGLGPASAPKRSKLFVHNVRLHVSLNGRTEGTRRGWVTAVYRRAKNDQIPNLTAMMEFTRTLCSNGRKTKTRTEVRRAFRMTSFVGPLPPYSLVTKRTCESVPALFLILQYMLEVRCTDLPSRSTRQYPVSSAPARSCYCICWPIQLLLWPTGRSKHQHGLQIQENLFWD